MENLMNTIPLPKPTAASAAPATATDDNSRNKSLQDDLSSDEEEEIDQKVITSRPS
jgi:hypothetical protein